MQGWHYGKGLIYYRPIFRLTKLAFLRPLELYREPWPYGDRMIFNFNISPLKSLTLTLTLKPKCKDSTYFKLCGAGELPAQGHFLRSYLFDDTIILVLFI